MRTKYLFHVILLFVISNSNVFAQQTDSLSNAIKQQKGIPKIQSQLELAKQIYPSDKDKTIALCHEAISEAKKKDSLTYVSKGYKYIGMAYWASGQLDTASLYLTKALNHASKNEDGTYKGQLSDYLMRIYTANAQYDSAIAYGIASLKIYTELKDTNLVADTKSKIGNIYVYLEELTPALAYQKEALVLAKQTNNSRILGKVFNTIGYIYDERRQFDIAIIAYEESLVHRRKAEDLTGELYTQTNLCVAYRNEERDDEALACNQKNLAMSRMLDVPSIEAVSLLNVGINLSDLKKYQASNRYLDTALVLLNEQTDIINQREAEGMLWYNYEKLHQYDSALSHYKKYTYWADSILSIEKFNAVEDMRSKYESDKKEASNQLLQAQNVAKDLIIQQGKTQRNILLISGIALLVLVLLLVNRYRLKQKSLLAEKELASQFAVTKAEMESRENERSRIAQELHDGIGQQLTAIHLSAQATNNDKITDLVQKTASDVRQLSHQMMPKALEKLGLDQALKDLIVSLPSELIRFHYNSRKFTNTIDKFASVSLYRIAQECINNAIKHSGATEVDVLLQETTDSVILRISDNGTFKQNDKGHGLDNIQARCKSIQASFILETSEGTECIVKLKK